MITLSPGLLLATTWAPAEKIDPVSGEKTAVEVIISYGGYIYGWPSKYDLVFWPLTDENWVWFNPKSGYAAFGSDFEKLSDADKETLRAVTSLYLDENKIIQILNCFCYTSLTVIPAKGGSLNDHG